MKKKDIQKERWFILGIIESEDKKGRPVIEAVKIYNPFTEESKLESLNTLMQEIDAGKEIIGARIRETRRYNESREEHIINREVLVKSQYFKTSELARLNGAGDIIKPGKAVVVGCIDKHGKEKFIVVTASLKKQYLTKEEVIDGEYIGVYRRNIMRASQTRLDLLKEEKQE